MAKIQVNDISVRVIQLNDQDYISLTDMLKARDGVFFFHNWLRNRNTIEFLGVWEKVNNINFNCVEFDRIKSHAGLNSFRISAKNGWRRLALSELFQKPVDMEGTYAHKDIAFEFAMWISPEFKVYLIHEFQRLKENEQKLIGWSAKRELSKINYRIHTDAIKQKLIPPTLTKSQTQLVYANEADVLNMAIFGMTAKQWREINPDLKGNIRDYASVNQLICLANLESMNAVMINKGISQSNRLIELNSMAIHQMSVLEDYDNRKLLK